MEIGLIAFDGLDPRVVYGNEDKLTNLHNFMEESMHGKWRTPGHTIPSFTATVTGRKYNEVDFHWDGREGGYQRHRQTGYDYIWDVCDSSMTLMNIPTLYPPEDIEDAMVCGFLTPESVVDSNIALPQKVQEKVNEIDYIHDVRTDRDYNELGPDGLFDLLCEMMETRLELAEWLVDEYDSDLFYGAWTAPDRWFHKAIQCGHDHVKMYEEVDRLLPRILDLIPDGAPTVVFSDHGFGHHHGDDIVHKGHMYEGWYSIQTSHLPEYRDDSLNILDLYPTVVNYLEGEVPEHARGRVLFHNEEQEEDVKDRLGGLGYM